MLVQQERSPVDNHQYYGNGVANRCFYCKAEPIERNAQNAGSIAEMSVCTMIKVQNQSMILTMSATV